MNPFKDYRLTPGHARPIKIVRHHNKWLNGKTGVLVGKDVVGFYSQRVWLPTEQLTVIVHQTNIVPAEAQARSLIDIFEIYWKIFWHNVAIKIQGWLYK